MASSNVDFTEGKLIKKIIEYAILYFLASVFNEVYNITNSYIVGNYISINALSAVSACTWICNVFNYLSYGLGLGAGIIIANYYGEKNRKKMKSAVDTAILFAIVGGFTLTAFSELSLPIIMRICHIGGDIYQSAYGYLRVYLLGSACVLTYQMCFFILRSFGDSKHPLIFLIVSCFVNLGLGMLFVRVLDMSIIGTSLATIISQLIVCILCLNQLFKNDEFTFDIKNLHFSFDMAKRICTLGIPAGIQNMLIAISSLAVQSFVNQFPNEVIAGIGIAEKVGNWAQLPSLALTNALIATISQNIGAKNYDRIHDALKKIIIISNVFLVFFVSMIYVFSGNIVSIFNNSQEVIHHGSIMVRVIALSVFSLNLSHIFNCANRAAGNVNAPMLIAITAQVVCKYLFVYIGLKIYYNVNILYCGSAVGYSLAGIFATIYFFTSKRVKQLGLR